MYVCTYTDRVEIKYGKLVRIVNAMPISKSYKGKSLDVYREFEDGKCQCRNLYLSMFCYRVGIPNELNSLYANGTCSFMQKLEKWCNLERLEGFISHSNRPSENDIHTICSKYPEFIYIAKVYKGSIYGLMDILDIWKKHKEVEYLYKGGWLLLVHNRNFWNMSEQKRKEVVKYLRSNPSSKKMYLRDIYILLKYKITEKELAHYTETTDCKIKYDVFKYLEKCGLDDYNGMVLYKDYWRLLLQTNHNKKDSYWRFPKNLAKKHNELLKEVEQYNLLKESEKLRPKQERYYKAVKKLLKFKKEIDGYCVYIPETVADISYQARALNQCLIQCDYISKVINKECVLVFIRKNDVPIATAQLLKGDKIGQFYADELDRNNCLPTDEVRAVMNKWIEWKKNSVETKRRAA